MNRHHILCLSVTIALGLALLPSSTLAQQKSLKEQLVGTWTTVSADNVLPDGTKRQLFGANPKGLIIFDANGRYAFVHLDPDRPKIQSQQPIAGHAGGS